MPDEIRINRPMGRPEGSMAGDIRGGMPPAPAGSKAPWVILVVVILALVGGGLLFRDRLFPSSSDNENKAAESKPSGYQAVFLTNGQVYFGKLSDISGQYATLEDIYYLQVTTPPGLQGSQNQANAQAQQAQQQLSLVKLGQELHGPVDSMQINRDQILFFEDMKENGKVMEAIRQYQKNPPADNAQSNVPASNQPAPAPATNLNQ